MNWFDDINLLKTVPLAVNKISNLIDRKRKADDRLVQLPDENRTDYDQLKSNYIKNFNYRYLFEDRIDRDRDAVSIASWKLFLSDARVGGQLRGTCDDLCTSDNEGHPYRLFLNVKDKPKPRIKKMFDSLLQLNDDLDLEQLAWNICLRELLEGSCFCEIVVNPKNNKIIDFPIIEGAREGYIVRRLIDKETNIPIGYAQYSSKLGQICRVFKNWQVVQFDFCKTGFYGIPLLGSIIVDGNKLQDMENDMAIARKERAYLKYSHIYDGASPDQILKISQQHAEIHSQKGAGPSSDLFTNKKIELLDPRNTQLANIADVLHLKDKIFTAMQRPKGLAAGEGKDINRSILEEQEKSYSRYLTRLRAGITKGYLNLFETQMILADFYASDLPMKMLWTETETDTYLNTASALNIACENGLSQYTLIEEMGFDPELEMQRRKLDVVPIKTQNEKSNSANDPNDGKNTGKNAAPKKASFQRNGNGTVAKRNTESVMRPRKIWRVNSTQD